MSDGYDGDELPMVTIQEEVEAVLLNSECDPHEAVEEALRAVVRFAVVEIDCGAPELLLRILGQAIAEESA